MLNGIYSEVYRIFQDTEISDESLNLADCVLQQAFNSALYQVHAQVYQMLGSFDQELNQASLAIDSMIESLYYEDEDDEDDY